MSIKNNRELMVEQIKRLRAELKESVNEARSFKVGDKVTWNDRFGFNIGTIEKLKGNTAVINHMNKNGTYVKRTVTKDELTHQKSVNEARMKEDDFIDRLEDYASEVIPSKDYIKKSTRDLLKQLIGNMRTDKKAKALYTYWSKNKGKDLLDKMGSLFESVNEATIVEGYSEEEKRIVLLAVRKLMKYKNVDIKTAAMYVVGAAEELKKDIDKGKVKK